MRFLHQIEVGRVAFFLVVFQAGLGLNTVLGSEISEEVLRSLERATVLVLSDRKKDGCSGVVVGEQFVATAAHCVLEPWVFSADIPKSENAPALASQLNGLTVGGVDWKELVADTRHEGQAVLRGDLHVVYEGGLVRVKRVFVDSGFLKDRKDPSAVLFGEKGALSGEVTIASFFDRALIQVEPLTDISPVLFALSQLFEVLNRGVGRGISLGYPYNDWGRQELVTLEFGLSLTPFPPKFAGHKTITKRSLSFREWYYLRSPSEQEPKDRIGYGASGGPTFVALSGICYLTGIHSMSSADWVGGQHHSIDVSTFGMELLLDQLRHGVSKTDLPR